MGHLLSRRELRTGLIIQKYSMYSKHDCRYFILEVLGEFYAIPILLDTNEVEKKAKDLLSYLNKLYNIQHKYISVDIFDSEEMDIFSFDIYPRDLLPLKKITLSYSKENPESRFIYIDRSNIIGYCPITDVYKKDYDIMTKISIFNKNKIKNFYDSKEAINVIFSNPVKGELIDFGNAKTIYLQKED